MPKEIKVLVNALVFPFHTMISFHLQKMDKGISFQRNCGAALIFILVGGRNECMVDQQSNVAK